MSETNDGPDNRATWQEMIIADRMAVDQRFSDEVAASPLSGSSWELVMTAVELEIRNPEEPETAEIVANTDRVGSVLSAIGDIEQRTPGPGAGGDRGLLARLGQALPWQSDEGDEHRDAAVRLADRYAAALTEQLQETDRWAAVCAAAAEERST